MTKHRDALIAYRLERAREALEEARLLADHGHRNASSQPVILRLFLRGERIVVFARAVGGEAFRSSLPVWASFCEDRHGVERPSGLLQ